jgi:hypothetical protein
MKMLQDAAYKISQAMGYSAKSKIKTDQNERH